MLISVIVVLFSGIMYVLFDSQRDKIIFSPGNSWFPNWVWWAKLNKKRSDLVKYSFSFWADGFHYTKSAALYMFCMQGAYIISINIELQQYYAQWLFIFFASIALYAIYGLAFNLFYHVITIINSRKQ